MNAPNAETELGITTDPNVYVDYDEAVEAIERCMDAKLVPFLKASPGVGKSDLARSIAKKHNLFFIDIRLATYEPPDLGGFAVPNHDNQRISYFPTDLLPLEGDEIPEGYNGFFVNFDELNHCNIGMTRAAYKTILDRQVGTKNLHEKCFVMAAGNLDTDNAGTEELPTAMQSRLIHLRLRGSTEQWIDWANASGIDSRITAYINFKSGSLNTFNPDHTDDTYACPRTWEFANRLIKNSTLIERGKDLPVLAGTLSVGVATEFINFLKVFDSLITVEQIIADPEGIDIPTGRRDVISAISATIAERANKANLEALAKFINRLPAEFQIITMKGIVKRHAELISEPTLLEWVQSNSKKYFTPA